MKSSNPNESYSIGLKYLQTKFKTIDWYQIISSVKTVIDKEIRLLLEQYYFGYAVRYELYHSLCKIKIMKYNRQTNESTWKDEYLIHEP